MMGTIGENLAKAAKEAMVTVVAKETVVALAIVVARAAEEMTTIGLETTIDSAIAVAKAVKEIRTRVACNASIAKSSDTLHVIALSRQSRRVVAKLSSGTIETRSATIAKHSAISLVIAQSQ